MDKIFDMIWWPMVVALIPLDAGIIMHYIHEEYFGVHFWIMVVLYILLCASAGARIYLIEKKGKK